MILIYIIFQAVFLYFLTRIWKDKEVSFKISLLYVPSILWLFIIRQFGGFKDLCDSYSEITLFNNYWEQAKTFFIVGAVSTLVISLFYFTAGIFMYWLMGIINILSDFIVSKEDDNGHTENFFTQKINWCDKRKGSFVESVEDKSVEYIILINLTISVTLSYFIIA